MCSQAVMSYVMLHSRHRHKVAVHPNTLMSTALGLAVLQVRLIPFSLCYVELFVFITLCECWTQRASRSILVWLLKVQSTKLVTSCKHTARLLHL